MSPPLEPHDYIGLSAAAASPTPSSSSCSSSPNPGGEARGPRLTLRLGLPGSETRRPPPPLRRLQSKIREIRCGAGVCACAAVLVLIGDGDVEPRAQVVGWPPVRNYRKNTLAASASKGKGEDKGTAEGGPLYVKVSMDGAPYLRKVDLKMYSSYEDLSMALEKMFSCFITGQSGLRKSSNRDRLTNGSKADALQDQEYVLTYEDKDADWMLVGDLPWDLFTTICRKLKIMRGSDAAGIAPRSIEQSGQSR
uniref:Auxin-responsive protein n=1 Tax=Oryza barthii TaxID=65489 RepID=A0A0D3ESF2_9ORYZ